MTQIYCRNALITGNERSACREYLGIPYAHADRFAYAEMIDPQEEIDATQYGDACTQYRTYFPHLDVPERRFYQRELRNDQTFTYSQDCLNLNIYTPLKEGRYPVIIFIHGGGFNSMCNCENYLDGEGYAKRDIILVTINYRLGIFGWYTNEEIQKKYGRNGNFGLDDMVTAIRWVKKYISCFGGDPDNITLMGQSAGAISIQYLCLVPELNGLWKHAVMLSGAGAFPKFALPRKVEDTEEYWKEVMQEAGTESFAEFQKMNAEKVLAAVETIKTRHKDNTQNTMPVIDGYFFHDSIDHLISKPMSIDYMADVTNNDMYTLILYRMAQTFCKAGKGYFSFFDINAPGDHNLAFHSSDLRYVFGTLERSWRPYDDKDHQVSETIMDYIASFARTGNPNGNNRPHWIPGAKPLCITRKKIQMGRPSFFRLLRNTFKGDPR